MCISADSLFLPIKANENPSFQNTIQKVSSKIALVVCVPDFYARSIFCTNYKFSESGITGCTGQASERNYKGSNPPVYAAWSRENNKGVMKIDGSFYGFSYSDNGFDNYNARNNSINWRIGSLVFRLRYSSIPTAEELYEGNGEIRVTDLTKGRVMTIPVRVSGGC